MRIPQSAQKKTAYDLALEKRAFLAWALTIDEENQSSLDRAKKALSFAIKQELSPRQKLYLTSYYSGETMPSIARKNEVNVSTVSRTIHRAYNRLRRVLKYCGPELLEACAAADEASGKHGTGTANRAVPGILWGSENR